MSDRPQDQAVTLGALRAAAKAFLDQPPPHMELNTIGWQPLAEFYDKDRNYEGARAYFWRLAYLWQRESETRFRDGQLPMTEQSAFEGIIAEVEART